MIVTVSNRHMDVSPALKQRAEEGAQKFVKFYDRIQEVEVTFDRSDRDKHTEVEIIVNGEQSNLFVGKATNADPHVGFDEAEAKVLRQLRDHHSKTKNRKHPE